MKKIKNFFTLAMIPLMSHGGVESFPEPVLQTISNYLNVEEFNRLGLCNKQLQQESTRILSQIIMAEHALTVLRGIREHYESFWNYASYKLFTESAPMSSYKTRLNQSIVYMLSMNNALLHYSPGRGGVRMSEYLEKLKSGNNSDTQYSTEIGHIHLESCTQYLAKLKEKRSTLEQEDDGFENSNRRSFTYGDKNRDNFQKLAKLIADFEKVYRIFKWALAQADQLKTASESET